MDSYNFSIPILLDDEDCCLDCGRELENGPRTICEYCNKRYQREWEIEREMALEPDIPFTDEDTRSILGE